MEKVLKNRTIVILFAIIIMTAASLTLVIFRAAIVPGVDEKSDTIKKNLDVFFASNEVIEGNIVDRKGEVLSRGKETKSAGQIMYPHQYSWIFGYINSFAYENKNHIAKEDERKPYFGLREKYFNDLYKKGGDKGATLKLTIDNNAQMKTYSILKKRCASVVVINYKTGKIRCLVNSQPIEYNANYPGLSEKQEEIDNYSTPNYFVEKEPGSVFKIVTAAALIQSGNQNLTFDVQPNQYIANHIIKNVSKRSWKSMNLEQALGYSCNTYFAQAALKMGGHELEKVARKFNLHINKNYKFKDGIKNIKENIAKASRIRKRDKQSKIIFDFEPKSISSNFDLKGNNPDNVADAAYGQGNTLITPIQLAMIYQAIANNGKMIKPYMIDDIIHDGKSILSNKKRKAKQKELKTIKKSTAKELQRMLKKNVDYYYNRVNTVQDLHAKTGTSQITGNYKYRKTIASFDSKYVVVITEDSNEGFGIDLWEDLMSVYKALY